MEELMGDRDITNLDTNSTLERPSNDVCKPPRKPKKDDEAGGDGANAGNIYLASKN